MSLQRLVWLDCFPDQPGVDQTRNFIIDQGYSTRVCAVENVVCVSDLLYRDFGYFRFWGPLTEKRQQFWTVVHKLHERALTSLFQPTHLPVWAGGVFFAGFGWVPLCRAARCDEFVVYRVDVVEHLIPWQHGMSPPDPLEAVRPVQPDRRGVQRAQGHRRHPAVQVQQVPEGQRVLRDAAKEGAQLHHRSLCRKSQIRNHGAFAPRLPLSTYVHDIRRFAFTEFQGQKQGLDEAGLDKRVQEQSVLVCSGAGLHGPSGDLQARTALLRCDNQPFLFQVGYGSVYVQSHVRVQTSSQSEKKRWKTTVFVKPSSTSSFRQHSTFNCWTTCSAPSFWKFPHLGHTSTGFWFLQATQVDSCDKCFYVGNYLFSNRFCDTSLFSSIVDSVK